MSTALIHPEAVLHDALQDLCTPLFASLRRSDQRRRGTEYIHGLLSTHGRKSIRNMAALIGGSSTGQSLHHFICSSTWDWIPVRRAMAEYLMRSAPPQAYVARPMTIPKVGRHSVGVSRYFSADEGQALNAQRAIGVWGVADTVTAPLNWRLFLPQVWIKDGLRRNQASIPYAAEPETISDGVLTACRESLVDWELPPLPVVVDIDEADPVATVLGLHAQGLPSMVRVHGELPLCVNDPALTGHSARRMTAPEIMQAARALFRPVARTALVASVGVRVPGTGPGGAPLSLVGITAPGRREPAELWLTDLPHPTAAALRLTGFARRVDQDFDGVTAQVGIRDYVGRSYSGWHRHTTLASAAHAVSVLSGVGAAPQLRQAS
ncbi:transposase [Streptomyces sp. LHD-70]|uniref:IS701 family transposase n=1 Tax=Streptomyces sp. LHD-70 TaxID=3072140 RepID=UPI00280F8BE4|nr:transposase [Streptomyces sp. LHD-70]MDQ8707280.1 transposase [Streptomyces sp. LHD-70]